MLPFLPFPETQASLALSIVLFSFAYEDGATLLAAALTTAGRLDARLGLVSAFLGIWIGDLGLYAAGATLGRRLVRSNWTSRFVSSTKLDKAESWFAERGPATLVMSRFIPGSRLPLYLAAGTLRLSAKMFTVVTGFCSAVWVTVIFVVWHFIPRPLPGFGTSHSVAAGGRGPARSLVAQQGSSAGWAASSNPVQKVPALGVLAGLVVLPAGSGDVCVVRIALSRAVLANGRQPIFPERRHRRGIQD